MRLAQVNEFVDHDVLDDTRGQRDDLPVEEEAAALAARPPPVAEVLHGVERDLLRAAHERLRLELELLKRRIFAAKAERVDTAQLDLETTPMPAESFARSLAAPSMLAHVISDKLTDGLPLNRTQERFAREECPVDRGTMCRWVEDAGATLGATVIAAARAEAMATAFCIATDATGISVQPEPLESKQRQACRRGHY